MQLCINRRRWWRQLALQLFAVFGVFVLCRFPLVVTTIDRCFPACFCGLLLFLLKLAFLLLQLVAVLVDLLVNRFRLYSWLWLSWCGLLEG